VRHLRRRGRYERVADPHWLDPLDGRYSAEHGGRWNAPGCFPVVYLTRGLPGARAYVRRKLAGRPYGPELLAPEEAPVLIETELPEERYVDVVTEAGCKAVDLPPTYPRDAAGAEVPWARCQPIGRRAWDAGELGIACRSALGPAAGEELAWFHRERRAALPLRRRLPFEAWYWPAASC
jgi:RES domain-containing protein